MNISPNRSFDTVSTPARNAHRHRRGLMFCGLLALLALAFLGRPTAAYAQATTTSLTPEGSWLYAVTIPDFTTFQGVETYSAGGGFSEADQLSFNPASVAGAGHGAWKSKGQKKFLLTHVNLTFDAYGAGTATGRLKVRQRAKFDKTGHTYSGGTGDYTYFDTSGNVVHTGPFTITATRIGVEAPAAPTP